LSLSIDTESFIPFIDEVLKDQEMTLRFAGGPNKLAGAEIIFTKKFDSVLQGKSTLKV